MEQGPFWTSFSLYTNYNDMVKINKSKNTIGCINGLKVIFCMVIIAGHRRDFFMYPDRKVYKWNLKWGGDGILSYFDVYNHSVDVFFVCSGVLVTISMTRLFER